MVSSKAGAELLIEEWLKACTKEFTLPAAQNMRPVKDTIHDLVEVVKYGSKIFTDPTMQKGRTKATPDVYVAAFHNIICAMEGLRVFDRFGFNACTNLKSKSQKSIIEYEVLFFDLQHYDWIALDCFEKLSGYLPPLELRTIPHNNLDMWTCNKKPDKKLSCIFDFH